MPTIRQACDERAATYDLDRQTMANLRCKSILELGYGTGKYTALLAGGFGPMVARRR